MPEYREIPCEHCEANKREIEEDGIWEFLECKPIETRPGWCRLAYQLKE